MDKQPQNQTRPGPGSLHTEAELVTRAQQGDREAFGELVLSHYPGVIGVVYRMCGNAALAEDAAQEAFLQAWLRLPAYQPRNPLRNWLYRIAVNAALDALRRGPRTVPLDDLPGANLPVGDSHLDPEQRLEQREREALVQEAVLRLPPASRAVLVLREYEGLSYREIAETLDIQIGTVMSRLNYARGRLRERLEPYFQESEADDE
jgi:RNA polymerase sigma-70 factor (ECF subfamily)